MAATKKTISVVAAIVRDGEKYLCMQRCRSTKPYNSEKWEFPGGKVKPGETHFAALQREIKEEMDWNLYVGRKLVTIQHAYPDCIIRLHAYLCKPGDGDFKLLEHLDYKWLPLADMPQLDWAEADKKILKAIQAAQ